MYLWNFVTISANIMCQRVSVKSDIGDHMFCNHIIVLSNNKVSLTNCLLWNSSFTKYKGYKGLRVTNLWRKYIHDINIIKSQNATIANGDRPHYKFSLHNTHIEGPLSLCIRLQVANRTIIPACHIEWVLHYVEAMNEYGHFWMVSWRQNKYDLNSLLLTFYGHLIILPTIIEFAICIDMTVKCSLWVGGGAMLDSI